MKREPLLLVIAFLIATSAVQAQDWIYRTPIKNISDITEIDISPDGSIFLFDKSNLLNRMYVSENGGASYRLEGNGQGFDMQVLNDNLAYLVANNRVIKSTDKFLTSQQFPVLSFRLTSIFFLNELEGYVSGGNGEIWKTIDGGNNWTRQTTGTTENINDVYFLDSNNGFACGDDRTFLSTTDGGTTWNPIILPIQDFWPLHKITFSSANDGILIASGGFIFYTNDAGVTWNTATSGTNEQLNDVDYINNQYYIVGNDGIVLNSNDLGQTWSLQDLGRDDLYSIAGTPSILYIGSEEIVLQSTDNGTTWNSYLEDFTMSDLEQASFANSNTGLIVGIGNNGSAVFRDVMYRTTDAGVSWERKTVSGGYYAVQLKENGEALTTNFNINRVSYSDDFGDTWTNITGPNITQQFIAKDVWLKSKDDFFVVGGNFFASDGIYRFQTGTGWTHDTTTGNTEFIKFLDDNVGVATNTSNQAFKTLDGGTTWTPINYNGGNFEGIEFIDANTFYIGQQVTTDGGLTFQFHNFPGVILSYRFFTSTFGIGMNSNGDVYQTLDGGNNWQLILDPVTNVGTKFFITEDVIYNFQSRTDIYTLDISTVLSNPENTNQKELVSIYPNPTYNFVIIESSDTVAQKAEVFDLNGKLLKSIELTNRSTRLNLADLSDGLYFIHLMDAASRVISAHKVIKR